MLLWPRNILYRPRIRKFRQPDDDGKLFAFCKTARKPYDTAVTACLIILKHHLGNDIRVSSDGQREGGWQAGLEVVQAVLGYGECPMAREPTPYHYS